jgi:hypothetical protein
MRGVAERRGASVAMRRGALWGAAQICGALRCGAESREAESREAESREALRGAAKRSVAGSREELRRKSRISHPPIRI